MEPGSSSGRYQSTQQPQQGAPDTAQSNPHLPQPKIPRLTKEEISILEECNTESFWYRCVPLAVAFGGTTTYLVKTGHLKPHPRYGSTLKTLGAVFLGYVMGKMSYQTTCQQKIMDKIPHTNLALSVRKTRGITSIADGEMSMGGGADVEAPVSGKMRDEYSNIDVSPDSRVSNVKELDDSLRPSMDREVKQQDEAQFTDTQKTLTYDELRQRNRQEYEGSMATSPNSPFRQKPFPAPRPRQTDPDTDTYTTPPVPESRSRWDTPPPRSSGRTPTGQKKNEYGDVWDNN